MNRTVLLATLAGAVVIVALLLILRAGESPPPREVRYFKDQAYHFQTLRALSDIGAGGADTAEVLETIRHIRPGDAQSWFTAWEGTAQQVLRRAETTSDSRSRGLSLLRAHNYLRTAEFFLDPADEKRPASFSRSVELFYKGLDTLKVPYERIKVPYAGTHHLNAVYYPAPGGGSKPLILLCGGYDSTLEELYFVLVHEAHQRGYDVLTFEGPGQGSVLREQGLPFTPDWEKPTSAVLDAFLSSHPKPARIVSVGMSLGGYLAPRAAAFEPRIDGVVAYDVLYDFGEVARYNTPSLVFWLRERGWNSAIDALVRFKSAVSPGFAWGVANGKWVMGTRTPMETYDAMQKFTLAPVAARIQGDVLILAGTEDHFIPLKQVDDFKSVLSRARSVTTKVYDRASGGAEHCQLGAHTLWHADLFTWIAERFQ
jgi:alpha-beta hydrolase superfamily lysophospholipase